MEFNSKDYISSLHEASKSTVEGQALMDAKYSTTDVYNFDEIKKWFCRIYRSGEENLRSCDAYYQDDLSCLSSLMLSLIEFCDKIYGFYLTN